MTLNTRGVTRIKTLEWERDMSMEDAITKVLNDESLTTTEERTEALKKELATITIPKEKFNSQGDRLKNTEKELAEIKSEFEEFKKSKMTDDEKNEAREKEYAEKVSSNNLLASTLAVKELFLDNGIKISDDDAELKETLENIISEDKDKSIKLAKNFISLMNKTKEETKNETTTELLNNTPKPVGGVDSSATVSTVEELQKQYEEAIKNKDVVKQTQLLGQIFQEQQKQKV